MALPFNTGATGILDTSRPVGPFKASGAFYFVTRDSSRPKMWKATDPESSWSAQDVAGQSAIDQADLWAYQDGTDIWVAGQEELVVGDGTVLFHRFDTISDTWAVVDEVIETPNDQPTKDSVCVFARGADIVVGYDGDQDKVMGTNFDRVDYARKVSGSWTTGINLGGSGEEADHAIITGVLGNSSKSHFFWSKLVSLQKRVHHRSVDSANSLGTEHELAGLNVLQERRGLSQPIFYMDGAVERITVAFVPSGAAPVLKSSIVEDDAGFDTPDDIGSGDTEGPHLALQGTKNLHCVFRDQTSPVKLKRSDNDDDNGWAAETTIVQSAIDDHSINIYDRSGLKLAMVYDTGIDIWYDEVSLAGETPVSQTAESGYEGLGGLSPSELKAFESLVGVRREL